jgi:hypothetical protein
MLSKSSTFQVDPRAVEHGKHAAGTPLKKRVPRTPLGPSEHRMAGMLRRGMGTVCQKSAPGQLVRLHSCFAEKPWADQL